MRPTHARAYVAAYRTMASGRDSEVIFAKAGVIGLSPIPDSLCRQIPSYCLRQCLYIFYINVIAQFFSLVKCFRALGGNISPRAVPPRPKQLRAPPGKRVFPPAFTATAEQGGSIDF